MTGHLLVVLGSEVKVLHGQALQLELVNHDSPAHQAPQPPQGHTTIDEELAHA